MSEAEASEGRGRDRGKNGEEGRMKKNGRGSDAAGTEYK